MNFLFSSLKTLTRASRRSISITLAVAVLAGGVAVAATLQEYLLRQYGILALMSRERNDDASDKDRENQVKDLLGTDTITTLDGIANGGNGGDGDGSGGPGAPGSPGFGPGGGVNPGNVSGPVDNGVSPSSP